jgi:hypothetical protein
VGIELIPSKRTTEDCGEKGKSQNLKRKLDYI